MLLKKVLAPDDPAAGGGADQKPPKPAADANLPSKEDVAPKPQLQTKPPPPPQHNEGDDEDEDEEDRDKNLVIPPSAMRDIRAKERAKGAKKALEKLDAEAKELGYESYQAMRDAAKQALQAERQPPKPGKKQKPEAEDDEETPREKALREAVEKANAAVEKLQQEREQERREAERQAKIEERKNIERTLKRYATKHGVVDIDVALELFKKHVRGLSDADLEKFSEEEYFEKTLREQRPYLYGVEQRPADTGLGNRPSRSPAPPRKDPGFNAMDPKVSGEDIKKKLREWGLTGPSH